MNWMDTYRGKIVTPEQAVGVIQSGSRVFLTGNCSVPQKVTYVYRHYVISNSYVGIVPSENQVFYLGSEGRLMNIGELTAWLAMAGC